MSCDSWKLCPSSFRVVGGFETLTAMENVESDPKTDRPKVCVEHQRLCRRERTHMALCDSAVHPADASLKAELGGDDTT